MDRHSDAARLLLSARRDPTQRLHSLPEAMRPPAVEQAYLIQRGIMAELGEIGGWKVGHNPASGAFTCAPLPRMGVRPSPADIGPECEMRGLEAEIAVTMSADLPPREAPYTEAELRAAITSAHPAIEVLQTRYVDTSKVDPLSLLADSLSHFALVVGPAMEHWHNVDLMRETVRVIVAGRDIKSSRGNPAGAMLPLLVWLANVGSRWAGGLRAGQVVTTGSWTGADYAQAGQVVQVVFAHLGAAEVAFA